MFFYMATNHLILLNQIDKKKKKVTFLSIFSLYGSNLATERSSASGVKRKRFIRTAARTTIITNLNFLRALNDAVLSCYNNERHKILNYKSK